MCAQSCLNLREPMDCSLQALQSMGLPRQEYWTALPSPTQGDLPEPDMELTSLAFPELAGGFFTTALLGKP